MRDSQYLSVCKKHSPPVITRWERIIMSISAALGVMVPWITVSNKHLWWAYYVQSTGKAFVGIKMNRSLDLSSKWPWVLWRDMNQREKREASKTMLFWMSPSCLKVPKCYTTSIMNHFYIRSSCVASLLPCLSSSCLFFLPSFLPSFFPFLLDSSPSPSLSLACLPLSD